MILIKKHNYESKLILNYYQNYAVNPYNVFYNYKKKSIDINKS